MIVVFHKLKRGIGKQSLTALRDAQQTDKRNQPEVTVRTIQTIRKKFKRVFMLPRVPVQSPSLAIFKLDWARS